MCKNRIFSPPIIFLLAVFFCLIAVRVEQAAQQGPQPDKSANKARNSQPSGPQSSGGGAQEQKQEQKQESKTTPTPPAPEKQSPLRPQTSNQGGQDPPL